MSEDLSFMILIGFIAALFFGFIGLAGYGEYSERMACLERGGFMSRGGCLLHVSAPSEAAQ